MNISLKTISAHCRSIGPLLSRKLAAALVLGAGVAAMPVAASEIDAVHDSLRQAMPNLKKSDIRKSPVQGIYEVNRGMSYFYVTKDGRYVFSGDLVDVKNGQSITELRRKDVRMAQMKQLGDEAMISFPAKKEKYAVTVFTDIDCGYCRKLHREMTDYNDAGITVHYLFYPRSGPGTPSFTKAENVWCSENQNIAMTTAKNGGTVEAPQCTNPVGQHYELGQQMGVRGTPAVVLPDGGMQPGYLPADRLLAVLQQAN